MQERAVELVDTTAGEIKKRLGEKINELSSAMYRSMSSAPSVNPYSSTYRPSANSGAYNPNNSTAALGTAPQSAYVPLHLPPPVSNPVAVSYYGGASS